MAAAVEGKAAAAEMEDEMEAEMVEKMAGV